MALTDVPVELSSTPSIVDGGNTAAITIDSSENVGIGTSATSAKVIIDRGAGSSSPTTFTTANSYLQLGGGDYNTSGSVYTIGFGYTGGATNSPAYMGFQLTSTGSYTKGDLVFRTRDSTDDVATTERMRISSAGDVEVKGGNELRVYRTDNNAYGSIEYLTGTGGLKFKDVNGDGMTFAGASSTYVTITSAGNVGIGVPAPDQALIVKGSIETRATNSTNGWNIYTYTDNTFRINYNGAGADELVLDSSGNLLVGTTDTAPGVADTNVGVALNSGRVFASAEADYALNLNRNTSNGDTARFRKDGTTVGSIGGGLVSGSAFLTIGSGIANLFFQNSVIGPTASSSGASSNGAIDLGTSTARFKDIYLSGGVNFSANANAAGAQSELLDDYEEGTWTVGIQSTSGTSGSNVVTGITTDQAYYTKVGQNVNIYFYATGINLALLTSGTYVVLTGLPFQCDGYSDLNFTYRRPTTSPIVGGYVQTGTSYIYLCKDDGNEIVQSNNQSLTALIGSASYKTNS